MKMIKSLFGWIIKSKFRLVAAVIIVLLAIFGYFKIAGSKQSQPQYQTGQVQRGTIVSALTASGQIASAGNMPVTTQTSGVVKSVFVKNGDIVIAGQKLFEMIPDQQSLQKQTQAWASYLSAKSSLDVANQSLFSLQSDMFTKWKIYLDLAQTSTFQNSDGTPNTSNRQLPQFYSPYDDWLNAEAKYKNQQGVIAQAQAGLTSSWNAYQAVSPIVTAPIAGTVDDITLVLGMVISPSINSQGNSTAQRLATVKTDTTPIASFNLPEVDVTKVKAGQKVTITLDALPDKSFTGVVVGVDRTGNVASGVTNYPTTVQLDTQAVNVLTNMTATANIILDSKNDVLLVPSSAVQTTSGQSTVRILENGQPVTQDVSTGLTSDSQTEIVSGLKEGDTIIVSQSARQSNSTSSGNSPFGGFGGGRGFGGGGRGGG